MPPNEPPITTICFRLLFIVRPLQQRPEDPAHAIPVPRLQDGPHGTPWLAESSPLPLQERNTDLGSKPQLACGGGVCPEQSQDHRGVQKSRAASERRGIPPLDARPAG